MRVKHAFAFLMVVAFALAIATAALAAPGGDPGKPDDPGKSASAPGQTKTEATPGPDESQHDPSNPDGTYQGKSPSTPDQDGIGADHGIDNNDKTGEGTDGNNGCGNDPDREDDNNGWCGKPSPETSPSPSVAPTETSVSPSPQAQVLGRTFTRPEVLGETLARTGSPVAMAIAAGAILLTMGLGIRAFRKNPLY